MVIQGRLTRFAWGPNTVVGIEKLAVPPSTFGLAVPDLNVPIDERGPNAMLFQIENWMGQRIERNLGIPNQQARGWSTDRIMCYPDVWMTPEEASRL